MTIVDNTVDPAEVRFDSDEGLFTCTDLVSGEITRPAYTAFTDSGGNHTINIDANHALASVNSNADIVLGGMAVTTFGGSQGITGLGHFNAGGTYVHFQDGGRSFSTGAQVNEDVTNIAAYTFFASGGTLYLNERVYLSTNAIAADVTVSLTLLSVRFNYKLFVGLLV